MKRRVRSKVRQATFCKRFSKYHPFEPGCFMSVGKLEKIYTQSFVQSWLLCIKCNGCMKDIVDAIRGYQDGCAKKALTRGQSYKTI